MSLHGSPDASVPPFQTLGSATSQKGETLARSRAGKTAIELIAFMRLRCPAHTLHEIARVLRPGGFIQFSVAHPATSPLICRWVNDVSGTHQALATGAYLYEGATHRYVDLRRGAVRGA